MKIDDSILKKYLIDIVGYDPLDLEVVGHLPPRSNPIGDVFITTGIIHQGKNLAIPIYINNYHQWKMNKRDEIIDQLIGLI